MIVRYDFTVLSHVLFIASTKLLIHVLVCHLHKIVGVELTIVVTHVFPFSFRSYKV
jgi:hypothetical protein